MPTGVDKPKVRCFVCKNNILWHGFIYIEYLNAEPLWADNAKYMMRADEMAVVHGFTRKHAMNKISKYLEKRGITN